MINLSNKIVVSTVFTMRNSPYRDFWLFMTKFLIALMITQIGLSCWMLLYHFVFNGFTDFLAFKFTLSGYQNTLIYLFGYFFLPSALVVFLGLRKIKIEELYEKYPQAQNRKIFFRCFFGVEALTYCCLMAVI